MHQPDYRDYASGEFTAPWTYLHAIKDYCDMAWHLEHNPGARAVFNFVPILLDQLEDYAEQFRTGTIRDPLLRLLKKPRGETYSAAERQLLAESCFRSNHATMLEPFLAYKALHALWGAAAGGSGKGIAYLGDQFYADLVTWYHLAWTGETLRREKLLVRRLMDKGREFTPEDRGALCDLIGATISDLIPRYRRLAESGRIELSTTPHYHPILPLLIDLSCAREALPDSPMPAAKHYPGGAERAQFHVNAAREAYARRFGKEPTGVWPAEGGISTEAALMLARAGLRWTASGEGVLMNSLQAAAGKDVALPPRHEYLYCPYELRQGDAAITCFFRDDGLSDRIGFEYSKWVGGDAAQDFVASLEAIRAAAPADSTPVVSVILDGENAWEFFPYNGYYFLSELYQKLAAHPFIRMTTFEQYLASGEARAQTRPLRRVVAGSWVYGNFSTWIGSADKNRAWDLLCEAKARYDEIARGAEPTSLVARQLADCESSDWFWWFGDYNPGESVAVFDRLYRNNLSNLYRLLNLRVPESLKTPLSVGHGKPESGGAMRRAH
jgi:alpha-amylase/alpha-mannosidase (GH57 family)